MDLQGFRDALAAAAAAAAGAGWQGYGSTPGAATLPAVVAGFPGPVTFDGSYRFTRVICPVYLCVAPHYSRDAESKLLDVAAGVARALDAATGTAWRSMRFDRIDDTGEVVIGQTKALATTVYVEALITTTEGEP